MPERRKTEETGAATLEVEGVLVAAADLPGRYRTWLGELDGQRVLFMRRDMFESLGEMLAVIRAVPLPRPAT